MTPSPICVPLDTSLAMAAREMRDHDIGDLLVVEDGRLVGIVTDRDLVVRALAPGLDLDRTTVGEIGTRDVIAALPDDEITRVAQLMSAHSIRRLPVCDGGHPIGVISLGDIAVEFGGDRLADMQRTPQAVLADISEAPPNR